MAGRNRISYFSLAGRVPETSAMEPWYVTWLYDLISQAPVVRAAYRRILAGILAEEVVQGVVLDLGTGPGALAVELARRRPELRIVGLDLASHMAKRARQQAVWAGLDGRGLWPQADGHCLPFADGSCDLVISTFSMHHWLDPLRVLNEIARVLVPGGRYYIADVCREVNPFQRFFAYGSIPAASLPFGSYLGYGGYYESIRAGYTRLEADALLEQSALAPGKVTLNSTWFVPILTISSGGPA